MRKKRLGKMRASAAVPKMCVYALVNGGGVQHVLNLSSREDALQKLNKVYPNKDVHISKMVRPHRGIKGEEEIL